jgi:hypothetical protein
MADYRSWHEDGCSETLGHNYRMPECSRHVHNVEHAANCVECAERLGPKHRHDPALYKSCIKCRKLLP